MSWVRSDDREVYDRKVSELTDREYRERDGLLSYCAREHETTGFFHETERKHAGHGSPNGVRSLRKQTLLRLLTLGLVRTCESYSDDELKTLSIQRPEGHGWLRCTKWEKYNPPRDRTNAERQARYRNALRNGDGNESVTPPVTPPRARAAPASPSRPSSSTPLRSLDADSERADPEEQRLAAWQARAAHPDVHSPQAFVTAGMRSGGWPDEAPRAQTVNGSAPAGVGCDVCGAGGGLHAADCEHAARVEALRTAINEKEDE